MVIKTSFCKNSKFYLYTIDMIEAKCKFNKNSIKIFKTKEEFYYVKHKLYRS